MALQPFRLRRAVTLSLSILHQCLHQHKPISSISSHLLPPRTATPSFAQLKRPFTSTTALFRKTFDPQTEEIGPDTILFEGCDYNHWLITVDFPKETELTRDQMIETYVNMAAQVFGSVEEAKKKIYGLSTTTFHGFQVECSEETSEKFKGITGVAFVLPDSYIDPVNKEYGGDKYVNGEIFPRPPPVHYGKRNNNRDTRPREQMSYQPNAGYDNRGPPPRQNYGPPPQQNYGPLPPQDNGPPPPQNYGPPPQQNYGPPPPQNYGPPPPQNRGPPPPQNFGQTEQNYGPRPQQNYGPLTQQNYGSPPQQNYGLPSQQNYGPPPQQNYGPPPQQNYGPPPQRNNGPPQPSYATWLQQSYEPPQQQSFGNSPNFSPRQNYSPPGSGERRDFGQGQRDLQQGNLQSHVTPEQRGFSPDASYGSSQGGSFGHVSGGQRNFSSFGSN